MQTINKLVKICAIIEYLSEYYGKKEVEFITKYLLNLKQFNYDVEFIGDFNNDKKDTLNYIDYLSGDLTELTKIGQPCFILSDVAYSLLNKKFGKLDFDVFGVEKILYLFDITDKITYKDIDINKGEDILRPIVKKQLNNLSIEDLNKFFKKFAIYNKCSEVDREVVFEYKNKIYLNFDVCSGCEYIIVDREDIEDFVEDFVDNRDFEDFEVIIGELLGGVKYE